MDPNCGRARIFDWIDFKLDSDDGSLQTIIFDKYNIAFGADGIITVFVFISDDKGNTRTDSIMFACKPVDWSKVNYADPDQAE